MSIIPPTTEYDTPETVFRKATADQLTEFNRVFDDLLATRDAAIHAAHEEFKSACGIALGMYNRNTEAARTAYWRALGEGK